MLVDFFSMQEVPSFIYYFFIFLYKKKYLTEKSGPFFLGGDERKKLYSVASADLTF